MLGVSTVFPPRWLTYVGEMDLLYYRQNEKWGAPGAPPGWGFEQSARSSERWLH